MRLLLAANRKMEFPIPWNRNRPASLRKELRRCNRTMLNTKSHSDRKIRKIRKTKELLLKQKKETRHLVRQRESAPMGLGAINLNLLQS